MPKKEKKQNTKPSEETKKAVEQEVLENTNNEDSKKVYVKNTKKNSKSNIKKEENINKNEKAKNDSKNTTKKVEPNKTGK